MANTIHKIASLNRKDKTAAFLKDMLLQSLPEGYHLDIYLLDDRSPDATADYVKDNFPSAKVIEGTGWLYWAGGMRKVWNYELSQDDYDLFLLMNDDIKLSADALLKLLKARERSDKPASVLLGTVKSILNLNISLLKNASTY